MPLRALFLACYFLVSIPFCFVWPFYGILLWTVVSLLNPHQYSWATQILPWAMAVAIPTGLGFLAFVRGWNRFATRECLLIFLLWAWFTITTVVSTNTPLFVNHAPYTWFRWEFVSKVLLMTVLTVGIVDSMNRLRWLLITICGCFAFFVLKALPFMIATGAEYRLYGPPNSMIADNNDFGLALNMTLPLFFFLARTEFRPWIKRVFGFLFLITIPAIFFTYSRGAMVGLGVLLVLMFFRLKQRVVLVLVVVLGLVVGLLLAPEAWQRRMDPMTENALDGSARSRLNAWGFCWRLSLESPITGGGFEAFTPELFQRYAANPLDVHGPHSIYFGVLAEHGFVGLFLYLLFAVTIFRTTGRVGKQASLQGDAVIADYAEMFRFSLIGFWISGLFLGRAYFDYYFMIAACVAILDRLARAEWARPVWTGETAEEAA